MEHTFTVRTFEGESVGDDRGDVKDLGCRPVLSKLCTDFLFGSTSKFVLVVLLGMNTCLIECLGSFLRFPER